MKLNTIKYFFYTPILLLLTWQVKTYFFDTHIFAKQTKTFKQRIKAQPKLQIKDFCFKRDLNNKTINIKAQKATIENKNIFMPQQVTGNFYEINFSGKDLNYDHSNQTIAINEQTEYRHPNIKLIANNSLFDLKENKVTMENGVKCEILNLKQHDMQQSN